MARPLLTGGGPCAILACMDTDTQVGFPDDFPVNTLVRTEDGELLLRASPEYGPIALLVVTSDPTFTVHYQDEKSFIASAPDGSVGAWAVAPDGYWEARMNVTDEEAKAGLLDLARRMTRLAEVKARFGSLF